MTETKPLKKPEPPPIQVERGDTLFDRIFLVGFLGSLALGLVVVLWSCGKHLQVSSDLTTVLRNNFDSWDMLCFGVSLFIFGILLGKVFAGPKADR